ncbi:hypothetical protein CKAH01_01759 [Colletotrichum kahawae]|uniref:Uncharacterized protein n=1 Tax=Colletotrichum kahawae TaxID=34407 RepID=A0AAD9Y486_COLKA|nr:hypothetical protein CKAH01_01759 [Colletotrichum kahawae]
MDRGDLGGQQHGASLPLDLSPAPCGASWASAVPARRFYFCRGGRDVDRLMTSTEDGHHFLLLLQCFISFFLHICLSSASGSFPHTSAPALATENLMERGRNLGLLWLRGETRMNGESK